MKAHAVTDKSFVDFTVQGTIVQEGNIAFSRQGRGYHREGERLKGWREQIVFAARQEYKGIPWTGPVEVSLYFTYKPPRKAVSEQPKYTRPDADKLARAALDALTGILWNDDAQVTHLEVYKAYGQWAPAGDGGSEETNLTVNAMRLKR